MVCGVWESHRTHQSIFLVSGLDQKFSGWSIRLWQMCDQCVTKSLVTHLSHRISSILRWKKLRKLNCETKIDTAHSTCCLDTVLVTLRSNTTAFSSPTTKFYGAVQMSWRSRLATQRRCWVLCMVYRTHQSIFLASGLDRKFSGWRIWLWQMCDQTFGHTLVTHLSHTCHTQILHPNSPDRVQMQEISMGGSDGTPRTL